MNTKGIQIQRLHINITNTNTAKIGRVREINKQTINCSSMLFLTQYFEWKCFVAQLTCFTSAKQINTVVNKEEDIGLVDRTSCWSEKISVRTKRMDRRRGEEARLLCLDRG